MATDPLNMSVDAIADELRDNQARRISILSRASRCRDAAKKASLKKRYEALRARAEELLAASSLLKDEQAIEQRTIWVPFKEQS